MKFRFVLFVRTFCLLALAVILLVEASNLASISEIFSSHGTTFVKLTVRASHVSVPLRGYGEGACFKYTGRLYVHQGKASIPGPVVHVKPGGTLFLTLFNDLGKQMYVENEESMYSFHGVNTTNVHFHGVHGDPNVDNIFKVVPPGHFLKYKLEIPKNHLPGFHWYHTHAHGSSYSLLMGGLFGPFIVDAGTHDPFASLPSHILMIHLYRLKNSTTCSGMTMDFVDKAIGSNMSSRPRIVKQNGEELDMPSDLVLVNGQHKPIVKVNEGQPTLLRLAFAAGTCYLNVSLPRQCSYHVSAIDGVPLKCTRRIKNKWLYFTTATRYDLIVVCNKGASKDLPVIFKELGETIFYISITSEKRGFHNSKIAFPACSQLADVNYLPTNKSTMRRDISFSQLSVLPHSPKKFYVVGQGSNCFSLINSSTCHYEHFSGQKGQNSTWRYRGFVVPLDAVVEANVFGDPTDEMPHPLHLHVNHFVFVSFTPRKGGLHENVNMSDYGVFSGDIRDTIPIFDGVTVIRWRAASFSGEVVYHCHMLFHEDQGMMTSYLVYRDIERGDSHYGMLPYTNSRNKEEGKRTIFLVFFLIFLVCSLLCVFVRWMNTHSSGMSLSIRCCKEFIVQSLNYRYESSELERQHLC